MFRGILYYSHRLRCSSVTAGLSLPRVSRQIGLVGKQSSPIIPADEGDQIITADHELRGFLLLMSFTQAQWAESRRTN